MQLGYRDQMMAQGNKVCGLPPIPGTPPWELQAEAKLSAMYPGSNGPANLSASAI
ncbi:hypothetical protein AB5I41_01415 [Sphingomonas sp. MMS24-JH45]